MVCCLTRWVEAVPVADHKAATVAETFLQTALQWGAPDLIRTGTGPELRNTEFKVFIRQWVYLRGLEQSITRSHRV